MFSLVLLPSRLRSPLLCCISPSPEVQEWKLRGARLIRCRLLDRCSRSCCTFPPLLVCARSRAASCRGRRRLAPQTVPRRALRLQHVFAFGTQLSCGVGAELQRGAGADQDQIGLAVAVFEDVTALGHLLGIGVGLVTYGLSSEEQHRWVVRLPTATL